MSKLKSEKSRVFKFEKGEFWDGDEMIINWIMEMLGVSCGDLDNSKIKQKTYFTIHCAKDVSPKKGFQKDGGK